MVNRHRAASAVAVALVGIGSVTTAAMLTSGPDEPGSPEAAGPIASDTTQPAHEAVIVQRRSLQASLLLRGRTAVGTQDVVLPEGVIVTVVAEDGVRVAAGELLARHHPPAEDVLEAERTLEDRRLALRAAIATASGSERDEGASFTVEEAQIAVARAEADLANVHARGGEVTAPADGTVERSSSGDIRLVTGHQVRADLAPLQLLRLRAGSVDGTAHVETVTGQQVVVCRGLRLADDASAETPDATAGEPEAGATGSITCDLGPDVETVAGLPATLDVEVLLGEDVLVVPNLTVRYDEDGTAYVVRRSAGATERVEVTLGATDGIMRIVEGLEEGDQLELAARTGGDES